MAHRESLPQFFSSCATERQVRGRSLRSCLFWGMSDVQVCSAWCVFACQGAGNAAATSPARGGGRLAASSPRSAIARLPSGASPSPVIPPPRAGSAKGGGIPRPAHSVSAEPRAWPEVRRTAGSGGFLRGAASACGAVCRRPARSEYLPSPDRRHLACLRPRLPPSPPPPRAAAPPAAPLLHGT